MRLGDPRLLAALALRLRFDRLFARMQAVTHPEPRRTCPEEHTSFPKSVPLPLPQPLQGFYEVPRPEDGSFFDSLDWQDFVRQIKAEAAAPESILERMTLEQFRKLLADIQGALEEQDEQGKE